MHGHSPQRRSRDPLSYSIHEESPLEIIANRIGVTSVLFSIGMTASILLGRPRH